MMAQPFGGEELLFSKKSTQFDGVDEYVEITGNPASLRITNNLSVSFWVKYPSPVAGGGLVSKFDTSGGGQRSWILHSNNGAGGTDKMLMLISDNGINIRKQYVSSVTVLDGSWHQFAFTFATNVLKFYVDGAEDTSVNKQNDSVCNSLHDSTANILMAAYHISGSPTGFSASTLDEVSVWNKELSSSEISEIYNSGLPADLSTHSASANLVSFWRMGDGDTFPTITDNQSSNDGTMTNMESGDFIDDFPM